MSINYSKLILFFAFNLSILVAHGQIDVLGTFDKIHVELSSTNPDKSQIINYCDLIINNCNQSCSNDYPLEFSQIYYLKAEIESVIDYKIKFYNQSITYSLLNNSNLSLALNSLFKLSEFCSDNDYSCHSKLYSRSAYTFNLIDNPSIDDRHYYYWSQVYWSQMESYENNGKYIEEIGKLLLIEENEDFIYQKATLLENLSLFYLMDNKKCKEYGSLVLKLLNNRELDDYLNRILGRVNSWMVKPMINVNDKEILGDTLYINNSLDCYLNIKTKNKQDSIDLVNLYTTKRLHTKEDPTLMINLQLNRLKWINPKLLFYDNHMTGAYFQSHVSIIQNNYHLGNKEEAEKLYVKVSNVYENASSRIDIDSDIDQIVRSKINRMKSFVQREDVIINSESRISHYETGMTYMTLGLEDQAKAELKLAINEYLKRDKNINTQFDSTNVSSSYSALGHITNNPKCFWESIKYSNREKSIIGDYGNLIMHYCNNSSIDSIEYVYKEMVNYADSKNISNESYVINTLFTYLTCKNDYKNIIKYGEEYYLNLVEPIEKLEDVAIVQNLSTAYIYYGKYIDAINIISNVNLGEINKYNSGYHYTNNYRKSLAYSFVNLDSSIYYWKEMISTDYITDLLNFHDNDNQVNIQTQLSIIDRAFKCFNNKQNEIFSIVESDTFYLGEAIYSNDKLRFFDLLGHNDILLKFDRILDNINVTIYNEYGLTEDLFFTYDNYISNSSFDINLLWNELDQITNKYRNLYIVTNDIFDFTNFDAIENRKQGITINKEFNIFRIKSESNLFAYLSLQEEENTVLSMELVGAPSFSKNNLNTQVFGSSTRGVKNESEWLSLPYSQDEIEGISNILKEYNYDINILTGEMASEENVRSISNPTLIHIATHGFIDKNSEDDKYGIVLSGANDQVGKVVSNDGYLYSDDIAQLDLSKTKLAVISACESALYQQEGDRNITEALFEAGVDHQIVSLWKIDDEATKDLMISFYSNLAQTRNIRYAYNLAQNFMKEKYKDSYYWASFILISKDLNYDI